MPTNRTKRTRKFKASTISEAMRYFLFTGDYCLKKKLEILPHEKFEIFQLAQTRPEARERLRAIWKIHGEEVLRIWKAEKRPGLPWAARIFNE